MTPRGALALYLSFLAATAALVLWPLGVPAPDVPGPPAGFDGFVPEPSPLAWEAYRTGNALWVLGHLRRFGLLALALRTGLGPALVTRAAGGAGPVLGAVRGFLAFELAWVLVQLPFSLLLGLVRPHVLGLSRQSFARFAEHFLLGVGIELAIGAAAVGVTFFLMQRFRERWALAAWALLAPLAFVVMMVKPVWIDPLFQDFGAMRDKALEARILALAARCGVEAERVFEVDQSKDTKAVNGYVAGFLGTRRIVLWSTLVDRLAPDEVLAVMAHELGHDRLGHLALGFGLSVLGGLAGLMLLAWSHARLVAARGADFCVASPYAPAAWPVLRLLVMAIMLAGSPVELATSRWIEHQADVFALELTRDNAAVARAFAKLQVENLAIPRPGPLYVLLRATHPPLGARIDFAVGYTPWAGGGPLRYGSYFSSP